VTKTFALTHGDVTLRLLRQRDAKVLERLILSNREWLRPWEATNPMGPNSFDIKAMVKGLIRQLDEQSGLPCVIEFEGEVVGQLNVANILYGSVSSAVIGYWVVPEVAGKGVTPTSVALAVDYLFNAVGLHRAEIDIRPENLASLRVVEKLGFRYEGLKERFIHINGAWRDHYVFALTHEEVIGGVLNRWIKGQVPAYVYPWSEESRSGIKHTELNADEMGS
jgi:[ribosomal protein S5]-alanine N-acetyltransferase